MDAPDAILLLGLVVAGEMGWARPPAYRFPAADRPRSPGAPCGFRRPA